MIWSTKRNSSATMAIEPSKEQHLAYHALTKEQQRLVAALYDAPALRQPRDPARPTQARWVDLRRG